jgi:hypothetical protein
MCWLCFHLLQLLLQLLLLPLPIQLLLLLLPECMLRHDTLQPFFTAAAACLPLLRTLWLLCWRSCYHTPILLTHIKSSI